METFGTVNIERKRGNCRSETEEEEEEEESEDTEAVEDDKDRPGVKEEVDKVNERDKRRAEPLRSISRDAMVNELIILLRYRKSITNEGIKEIAEPANRNFRLGC